MSVGTFEQLAGRPDDDIDVALGAALIARDVYGNLDVDRVLARFDDLAQGLEDLADLPPEEQARRLSRHVYVELAFHGNEADYYDPRNSLLPDVLDRRTGIPISLALVYAEIGKRRRAEVHGVSFPGHFLACVGRGGAAVYVDPFFQGRVLGSADLRALLDRVSGQAGAKTDTIIDLSKHLTPATGRAILQRWLMNLRGIYLQRGDRARAMLVLDRLVCLTPDTAWPLRERGLLAARLGATEAARVDLERALKHCDPRSPDAQALRDDLEKLGREKRDLN